MAGEPSTGKSVPTETSTAWSRALTMVCGVFLIAVLTPLSQFLTMMTVNADVESSTPVGWAVGLVFSLVLVVAVLRLLLKRKVVSKANLVILYCMLTLAVPVMNVGVVRHVFLSMYAVIHEYMQVGTSTYRTAYNSLNPDWFPVAPTKEGLAWNKADRLLRLLADDKLIGDRKRAERQFDAVIISEKQRLSGVGGITTPSADELAKLWPVLGVDELIRARKQENEAALRSLGLWDVSSAELQRKTDASRQAAARLPGALAAFDEFEASLLPDNLARLDPKGLERVETQQRMLAGNERAALQKRTDALKSALTVLRADVMALSRPDWGRVRDEIAARYRAEYERLSADEWTEVRGSFVFRLSTQERNDLLKQDGMEDTPNQNLAAFTQSIWRDQATQQAKLRATFKENLTEVTDRLPWHMWTGPLVMWGVLFTALFLLMMCLAEWLRRKWVDRENLAFPIVEVVDHTIRHDAELETAEDIRHPQKRKWMFNPLFGLGFLIGFVILGIEALGHYDILHSHHVMFFDVSDKVLMNSTTFREMNHVYFVVSPIVVGLLFLVSLEISFSVWVIFFIYMLGVMSVKLAKVEFQDTIYLGWGGGRLFPFPAEQLLGASLIFAGIVLFKAWHASGKKTAPSAGPEPAAYIPPKVTTAGFIVLPVVIVALLWNLGITNLPFVGLIALFVLAITVAAARARAETGLHTHHVTYEFTKVPMVLGLTGFTGAKVFTRYLTIAFLPMTLLFRTLGQQLENIELARRYQVKYRTIAVAGLVAFLTALVVGLTSFLVFSYFWGDKFMGAKAFTGQGPASPFGIAQYPIWVSHFLGENGLESYRSPQWHRVGFMALGGGLFGLLFFLRNRFLSFPLHPLGYMLLLMSVYYEFVSPYYKGDGAATKENSWLWGSAFVAWLIKKLIVKYGGMNTYKHAKPFFIGLVIGSVFAVFAWNVTDLTCSIMAEQTTNPRGFINLFTDKPAFTPRFY